MKDLLYKRGRGRQINSAVLLINLVGQLLGLEDSPLSEFVSLQL